MSSSLHASLYTIYTEIKDDDRLLLLHGYTGAADLVGRNLASFLRDGGEIGRGSSTSNYRMSGDTATRLKDRGYLTCMIPDEERLYVSGLAGLLHRAAARLSSFFLLVAYDCNFACPYCYEGSISGFGNRWSNQVMTKELVDKAFVAMVHLNPERRLHGNNITLFGGEPLLADNHDIVCYIVGKGVREGYVSAAITNGYDLDRYADILKPGMLQFLQISLDGARDEHDNVRKHRDGSKTFDRIMDNIENALRSGVRVNVRVNINDGAAYGSRTSLLYDEFVGRKWVRSNLFHAYTARVHYPGKMSFDTPANCAPARDGAARCAAISFGREAGRNMHVGDTARLSDLRNRMWRFFDGETWALFRGDYCGATTGMFVFDPRGDIYPCLEAVGMTGHKIGTYYEKLEVVNPVVQKWRERKFADEDCRACKYFLFCGGGCPAGSILRNEATRRDKCDGFPAVFRKTVAETYREFSGNRYTPVNRVIPSEKVTNFHKGERREA